MRFFEPRGPQLPAAKVRFAGCLREKPLTFAPFVRQLQR